MKFLAIFTVALLFSVVHATKSEKEYFTAIVRSCQKEEGATKKDGDEIIEGISPKSPMGKCIVACIGERFGLFDEDNNFLKEEFLAKMALVVDEEDLENYEKVAETCEKLSAKDRCENSHLVWKCFKEETVKHHLKWH